MRSSCPASAVGRALAFTGAVLCTAPVQAEKRMVRRFPAPKWCSYISGHATPVDLLTPYTFTPPANRVTLLFKADNRNQQNDAWNNQRLDAVTVLRTADLPVGDDPSCFLDLSDGSPPAPVKAFPPSGGPAAFRDDFAGGARPEWGPVPAGSSDGTAPAPVFWLPTSSDGTPVSSDLLTEDFEDGQGQGWTSAPIAGATNLWRVAATDCQPLAGARHLAFSRPDPSCSYDVAVQGRVGGTYTSPVIDLSYVDTTTLPTVSFSHRWATGAQPTEWAVETSDDGGSTWSPLLTTQDRGASSGGLVVPEQLPVFSTSSRFRVRFRFDSGSVTTESGAGWYVDDIRVTATRASGGSLALGRSTRTNGTLVDSGEVVARLNLTNLTPGTEYTVMAKWNSVQGTTEVVPPPNLTAYFTIDHVFDATAPSNPTLTSPTHAPGVWSSAAQVTVQWSGAADEVGGSGLAGYSVAFDSAAGTVPDTTVDTPHATDPHTFTSATLLDGGSYYFHLRTCDFALNCSSAVHLGPFRIDTTPPSAVFSLTSPSHVVGVPSSDPTIDVTWSAATDASSGVDGYAFAFDGSPAWTCTQTKTAEESTTGTTSAPLAGGTWYFHICTRDNAGNWSSVATSGPYVITLPAALEFHTLTPCRLVDTRNASGPLGGPALGAGGQRTFDAVTACLVPATARALSVNVTVVGPTAPGDLRLYPPGGSLPLASAINYSAGQTRANNAVVPLNGLGQFAVRCDQATGSVHLLVDVNGYFE